MRENRQSIVTWTPTEGTEDGDSVDQNLGLLGLHGTEVQRINNRSNDSQYRGGAGYDDSCCRGAGG